MTKYTNYFTSKQKVKLQSLFEIILVFSQWEHEKQSKKESVTNVQND